MSDPQAIPALVAHMTAKTVNERDAAFLQTYAERVRNRTAASWETPNTVASTIEDIAGRIAQLRLDLEARTQERDKFEKLFESAEAEVLRYHAREDKFHAAEARVTHLRAALEKISQLPKMEIDSGFDAVEIAAEALK